MFRKRDNVGKRSGNSSTSLSSEHYKIDHGTGDYGPVIFSHGISRGELSLSTNFKLQNSSA